MNDDFDYDAYPPHGGTMEEMRVVMRHAELERLAAMACVTPDAEDAAKLAALSAEDMALVNFAMEIFRDRQCEVLTNPQTAHRYRLIARHLGATVKLVELRGGLKRMFFSPPLRR